MHINTAKMQLHTVFCTLINKIALFQLPHMFDSMEEMKFPMWADDMRKSMKEMHQRMMGWMKNSFNDDNHNFFSTDLKNDMSK